MCGSKIRTLSLPLATISYKTGKRMCSSKNRTFSLPLAYYLSQNGAGNVRFLELCILSPTKREVLGTSPSLCLCLPYTVSN